MDGQKPVWGLRIECSYTAVTIGPPTRTSFLSISAILWCRQQQLIPQWWRSGWNQKVNLVCENNDSRKLKKRKKPCVIKSSTNAPESYYTSTWTRRIPPENFWALCTGNSWLRSQNCYVLLLHRRRSIDDSFWNTSSQCIWKKKRFHEVPAGNHHWKVLEKPILEKLKSTKKSRTDESAENESPSNSSIRSSTFRTDSEYLNGGDIVSRVIYVSPWWQFSQYSANDYWSSSIW